MEKLILFILKLLGRQPSGLLKLKKDSRDFEMGSLFNLFGGYTPLHQEKILKTKSIKHQRQLSNCVFEATTVGKEVDEDKVLSPRYLTAEAHKRRLCNRGGYANLRSGQTILLDHGIVDSSICDNDTRLSFDAYINVPTNGREADKHKIKTYWKINNIDETLKAIDEGHPVVFGIGWYSGFNQGGGFRSPWIINKNVGNYCGGHALIAIGYKIDYKGQKVIVVQNSYSKDWGDNGRLYITFDFFKKYAISHGVYANLDIGYDKITAQDICRKYDNKNVKGESERGIYKIYSGRKYAYVSEKAFISWNGKPYWCKDMFTVVPQAELNKIPDGHGSGTLTVKSGKYADMVELLKDPVNNNFKR